MAVCTMQSGRSAVGALGLEGIGFAGGADAQALAEAGEIAGVTADLVRVGHEEADELELGMGVDAGQRMATYIAGAPLDDARGHGTLLC
jgi:hypothetical protein